MSYYELNLPPAVPRFRVDHTGHKRFNRGYQSPHKGKSYEELYGSERAAEIRQRISSGMKGIKFSPSRRPSRGIAVLQIQPDATVKWHRSVRAAALSVGITLNAVKDRIRRESNLDGRWFFEADTASWQSYLSILKTNQ